MLPSSSLTCLLTLDSIDRAGYQILVGRSISPGGEVTYPWHGEKCYDFSRVFRFLLRSFSACGRSGPATRRSSCAVGTARQRCPMCPHTPMPLGWWSWLSPWNLSRFLVRNGKVS